MSSTAITYITYAVCFDISDDRVRKRVGNHLMRYGERVQESVFEILVKTPGEFKLLYRRVQQELEASDKIRFYRLCAECRSASFDNAEGAIAYFPAVLIL